MPAGTAAKVVVNGKLTDVTQEGTLDGGRQDLQHAGRGVAEQGKLLTITVNMNVGSLTLTS